MDSNNTKKNLLFIEPFLSYRTFVSDAQMNGYGAFVLSDNDSYLHISKENFRIGPTFFQIDSFDDSSVLNIIRQIDQKFAIHGIIPEYEKYNLLSAKIAYQLNKPGLSLQAIDEIQKNKSVFNALKIDKKRKIFENKEEYRVDGLINNKSVFILTITEKLFLTDLSGRHEGYIVRAQMDSALLGKIIDCIQKTTLDLKVDYGFFYAQIKHQDNKIILRKFKIGFARDYMPQLISYATGLSYNHLIYKLFSSQPLSLHKGKKLSVGIIFFSKNIMCKKRIDEILSSQNPLLENREYGKENLFEKNFSQENSEADYVIFKHENYELVKEHIGKILIKPEGCKKLFS